ncbi:hypothetical protein BJH93_08955 [Kocuria polaris]|nr:hypothetical protein [Kocuria polaris]
MRIALFDGIMETHVVSSLERSLVGRGHDVLNTRKLAHGHTFITAADDIRRVDEAISQVHDFRPEVVVVFRPSSLPFPLLRRLRRAGGRLFAWFSDDPVLWNLTYGRVVDFYDVILHCGGSQVLEFYEQKHGRPTGVNFPFWSDGDAFPYVYGTKPSESDALFLGNVGDSIRRRRYYQLGLLNLNLRIHGQVGDDYLNLSGGYLDTTEEIVDAGARARLAINIPQFFSDHREAPTWFEGLDRLGSFEFPSRVIQCAAMGLPMVTLLEPGMTLNMFPEIRVAHDMHELERVSRQMLTTDDLSERSRRTRARFERIFTADSRAMALENLMEDESWRQLNARERATWFARFEAQRDSPLRSTRETTVPGSSDCAGSGGFETDRTDRIVLALDHHLQDVSVSASPIRVAVIGKGRGDHLSALRTATRALSALGHDVVDVLPNVLADCLSDDPQQEYRGIVDLDALHDLLAAHIDTYLFIGSDYVPSPVALRKLKRRADVNVVLHGLRESEYSDSLARLVVQSDAASFLHGSTRDSFVTRGLGSMLHIPDLVDREYLGMFRKLSDRYERVVVVAEREGQLRRYAEILSALEPLPVEPYFATEEQGKPHGLAKFARMAFSTLLVVLPDPSRPGAPLNRLFGHCLLSGALVIIPRGAASRENSPEQQAFISVADGRELRQKIQRLHEAPDQVAEMRRNAIRFGMEKFSAEEQLQRLLNASSRQVRMSPG